MSIRRWRVTERTEIADSRGDWVRYRDLVAEISVQELKVSEAQSALSAEVTRRQAAEAVVDAANRNSPDEQCNAAAFYRVLYPKETAI